LRRFFAARAAGVNGDGKDLKLSKTKWLAQTHASKVFCAAFFQKSGNNRERGSEA